LCREGFLITNLNCRPSPPRLARPTTARTPTAPLDFKADDLGFNETPATESTSAPDFDPTAPTDRAQITGAEQPQPGGTEPRTPQSDDEKLADKAVRLGFEGKVAARDQYYRRDDDYVSHPTRVLHFNQT